MGYRLYILSIRDLLDEKVRETAITYLDSHRLALVDKYKKEQDRLRAIAAGLLLQVGFLELEVGAGEVLDAGAGDDAGAGEVLGVGDDLSPNIFRLEVQEALTCLQDYANKHTVSLPVPLSYEYGTNGKPAWESRCIDQFKAFCDWACGFEQSQSSKKFPHFNLSHSGDYVVLAISDTPIGVDIQMERECDYPGGYKAFSRMEAFVKCTGDGIAKGRKRYEEMGNDLQKINVFQIEFWDEILYNVVVTSRIEGDIEMLPGLFEQVKLDESHTCVYWNDQIDLVSDTIYECGKEV